jgi:hypothetical protein
MLENFTTNAPDPLCWTQNSCLGRSRPFRCYTNVHAKLAELVAVMHKFAERRYVGKFPQWMHPTHSIGLKTHVLGRFGPFHYCAKVDAQLAILVPLTHKFAKESYVEKFRNECTCSTQLDPTLIFWGILDHFVTERMSMQTSWNGNLNAQVR